MPLWLLNYSPGNRVKTIALYRNRDRLVWKLDIAADILRSHPSESYGFIPWDIKMRPGSNLAS